MRTMEPIPPSPFRALDYTAVTGTYAGALDEVRWGYEKGWLRSQVRRALLRRRWFQFTITTAKHVFCGWIRDEGTTGEARLFVSDIAKGEVLAARSATGRPLGNLSVGPFSAGGSDAWLRIDNGRFEIERAAGDSAWTVEVDWDGVSLTAQIETAGAPDAATVIGSHADRRPSLTTRWNLLPVTGTLRIGVMEVPLDGALATVDYTNGFLKPGATWLQATGCGTLDDGTRIGFAISDGARHGDLEEAVIWVDDQVVQTERVRILVGGDVSRDTWRLRSAQGQFELKFRPNTSDRDPVRRLIGAGSIQRVGGVFMGRIPTPKGEITVRALPGLCELHR